MISIRGNFSHGPGCVFGLVGTIFVLVALILLAVAGGKMLREQGYQSGECTITGHELRHDVSTTTNTTSNGNTTYRTTTQTDVYSPYFEYTVHTSDGRSYAASGYDGSNTYTSDCAGQQAVVDHYKTEQSYPCWYNPANPAQAILVRQPDWLVILLGGGFLLLGTLFAIIGTFMFFGVFRRILVAFFLARMSSMGTKG
ncbi:MAG: hypothetical protein NVSMB44_37030 [Ktedonobacteraceae bacterium]